MWHCPPCNDAHRAVSKGKKGKGSPLNPIVAVVCRLVDTDNDGDDDVDCVGDCCCATFG